MQPWNGVHPGHLHTPSLLAIEQLRGSRLAESLASRGAVCEASHESFTSAMPCTPDLTAGAHTVLPHILPQVSSPLLVHLCFWLMLWIWPNFMRCDLV